jgi:DNA polymerase/3'-5' exonuclease PolX
MSEQIKKPRGRAPKNKTWNTTTGKWNDIDNMPTPKLIGTTTTTTTTNSAPIIIVPTTIQTNKNELIVNELETLRQKEFANNDKFRAMAYSKAIKIINENFANKNKPITSGKELKEFSGIGSKIVLKVDEILETGVLRVAEEARHDDKIGSITALSNVYGIGPVVANKLVNSMGIMTIEELKNKKDDIQENKRPLMNKKQQIGLKYYYELLERIPRPEMLKHEKIFKSMIKQINKTIPNTSMIVAGSFLRQAKDSGDIDILITNADDNNEAYHEFITQLKKKRYIIEELGYKDHKFLGISNLNEKSIPRRIDITFATHDEFPFTLLYFTGNGSFNTVFREHASTLGYRLNEHDLRNVSDKKKVSHHFKTEKDIFNFFKFPYLNPVDRTGNNLSEIINNLKSTTHN